MDYTRIRKEILADIDQGIYRNYPFLENKLMYIAQKCQYIQYTINATSLTNEEFNILKENEYVEL